jgi:ABC-type Fe3+-hydroxamate transport system substrate-binding protein
MLTYTDQMGHRINLAQTPKRIISLVPSQTEWLYSLGLQAEVLGITNFCTEPPHWYTTKVRIGGTKNVRLSRIHALKPDLIIANKEENVQATIKSLQQHYPVWVSDIHNLSQAYAMMLATGTMLGKKVIAQGLVAQIQQQFQDLVLLPKKRRVAYLIWQKPYMVVANNTFINHILSDVCGFVNVFGHQQRYPIVSMEQLQNAAIDILLLSSEPFPFKEPHKTEWQQYLPNSTIRLVDGALFSWYGSRLLHTPAYLQQLLHTLVS